MIEQSMLDIFGGLPLPSCPDNPYKHDDVYPLEQLPTSIYTLPNTSTSSLLIVASVIPLIISALIYFKMNKIYLFGRLVDFQSVQNLNYLYFFCVISFAHLINAIRYSVNLPYYSLLTRNSNNKNLKYLDDCLLILYSVSLAVSLYLLTAALNHHWKYRCNGFIAYEENEQLYNSNQFSLRNWMLQLYERLFGRKQNDLDQDEEQQPLIIQDDADSAMTSPSSTSSRLVGASRNRNQSSKFSSWIISKLPQFQMNFQRRNVLDFLLRNMSNLSVFILVVHLVFAFLYFILINDYYKNVIFFCIIISYLCLFIPIISLSMAILFSQTSQSSSSTSFILRLIRNSDQSTGQQDRQIVDKKEGPTFAGKLQLLFFNLLFFVGFSVQQSVLVRLIYEKSRQSGNFIFGQLLKCIPLLNSQHSKEDNVDSHEILSMSPLDIQIIIQIVAMIILYQFVKSEFRRVKIRLIWFLTKRVTGLINTEDQVELFEEVTSCTLNKEPFYSSINRHSIYEEEEDQMNEINFKTTKQQQEIDEMYIDVISE